MLRIRLTPAPEQGRALTETGRQFTDAFNLVCARGWQAGEKNGVTLHHATYRDSKSIAPALVSDLHVQARVKAIKSALTRQRHGRRTSCPRSRACPPRYNLHTYRVDWAARVVNLSTVAGRQRIPFRVPAYATRHVGCPTATADLVSKRGH